MIIDTLLKIDTASFMTGMGKAVQSVQSVINIAQGLNAKLEKAFEVGSSLSVLAKQTGEMPGSLMVLQRAFGDTGVGADAAGGMVAKLRKSLSDASDKGSATAKAFNKLGISVDGLKQMDAVGQFDAVGKAIMAIQNPIDRTAAAMDIFGKSGQSMIGLFASGNAFDQAKQSLGGLPEMMDRSAHAFNNISTRMGHIKKISEGFWIGFARGSLSASDKVTRNLDNIDFSRMGQNFGTTLSIIERIAADEGIGVAIYTTIANGFMQAANYAVKAFHVIRSNWYDYVVSPISALFEKWFTRYTLPTKEQEIASIKKLAAGTWTGYTMVGQWSSDRLSKELAKVEEKYKNGDPYADLRKSLNEMVDDARESYSYLKEIDWVPFKNISQSAAGTLWEKYKVEAIKRIEEIEDAANEAAINILGDFDETPFIEKMKNATLNIATDSLAKIGGFVGGFNPMNGLIDIQQNALGVQRNMLSRLDSIDRKSGRAVFA